MVTVAPTAPDEGEKVVILGLTMKLLVLVVVPPAFVIETVPEIAAAGTVTFKVVALVTEKLAGTSPVRPVNLTAVVPVNVFPVMVMVAPTWLWSGVKAVIVGAIAILSGALVPGGPVAVRLLVRAGWGGVGGRWVGLSGGKGMLVGPSLAAVMLVRFEPVTVMVSPAWAGLGEELVSLGRGLKLAVLAALPSAVVTTI